MPSPEDIQAVAHEHGGVIAMLYHEPEDAYEPCILRATRYPDDMVRLQFRDSKGGERLYLIPGHELPRFLERLQHIDPEAPPWPPDLSE